MRIIFVITAFLFLACSKKVELGQKSGILFLKDVEVGLEDLDNVEWDIGKKREVRISKGMRFDVQVPKPTKKAANILYNKYGIDSWIYRVTKITRGNRQHLGYVGVATRSGTHITSAVTIHVYYHAASVSREFRRFHCPAFEHRRELREFEIKETSKSRRDEIYVRPGDQILGEVSRISFSPLIFSAGTKLEGTYLIEIALFNSAEKRLYSSWMPLDEHIEVTQEVLKKVESCIGVKEEDKPLPSSRAPRIEDLQIR